ncbi:MAG: DUF1501 domain-containing protein [Planctomycetota bacterium]|jgi:uncharacterized protein (DUF1501 family)
MASTPFDRRSFLASGLKTGLAALGASLLGPQAFLQLASAAPFAGNEKILVILRLQGGNDGLNTCVPFGDDAYYKNRARIGIKPNEVVKLNNYLGLNPGLKALKAAYDEGDLAIVQGCSYPRPNRSHFKSMDIWETGAPNGRRAGTGWVGRTMDRLYPKGGEGDVMAAIGKNVPLSLFGQKLKPVAFRNPSQYKWHGQKDLAEEFEALNCEHGEAAVSNREFLEQIAASARASSDRVNKAAAGYKPKAQYPKNALSQALGLVVGLVAGKLPTRVFHLSMGGFDTHTQERNRHDRLMTVLGGTLAAFRKDLAAHGLADRVVLMAFSEFGRRVKENASAGTDHGVAGPMFLLGKPVSGGIHGEHPSLTDLNKGDLKMTTDFRQVYATLIEDWFGTKSIPVLGQAYDKLPLIGKGAR